MFLNFKKVASKGIGAFGLLFCFLVALSGLCSADNLGNRVRSVVAQRSGEDLVIRVELDKEADASVYFTRRPDRLIADFHGIGVGTRLRRKPNSPMLKTWSLKPLGLNGSRLALSLKYRPARPNLRVRQEGREIEIRLSDKAEVREEIFLTEGVKWIREDGFLGGRWTRTNQLVFDPQDPNVEVVLGLAKEKVNAREKLSAMVKRYGALAGINGGFFASRGGALGLVFRDGHMLAPHVSRRPPRSGFGITRDGRTLFGRIAANGRAIKDLDGGDWSQAWLALGGGPRLVKAGKAKITANLEELGPKGNDITRVAARTLVGQFRDGKLLFATVTGYSDNHLQGAKFEPVVGWLKSLGIVDAVNFDGGASVDMVVDGHIVSDGPGNRTKEKPVATALLIRDERPRQMPHKLRWDLGAKLLPADGETVVPLTLTVLNRQGSPVPDGTPVSLIGLGIKVEPDFALTKNGRVEADVTSVRRPGSPTIEVSTGPLWESRRLKLSSGYASRLLTHVGEARESKDFEGYQTRVVRIQIVDQWGNGVGRQSLTCSVDGSEELSLRTNRSGLVSVEVDNPISGGVVKLSHPTLGTQSLRIGAMGRENRE